MLTKGAKKLFNSLEQPIPTVKDLLSCIKIAELINNIFYEGKNQNFYNKIIKQNTERKGNHIINASNILKQIKNDENISLPDFVRNLSSFSMIQNQEQFVRFIEWLAQEYELRSLKKSNRNMQQLHVQAQQHYSPMQSDRNQFVQLPDSQNNQDEAFQNVYFCHKDLSPQASPPAFHDSLDDSQKVVKKGSFKVIRPKSGFKNQQINKNSPSKLSEEQMKKQCIFIDDKVISQQDHQYSARKTVPKLAERPPLYRKVNKEATQNQKKTQYQHPNFATPAPFSSSVASNKKQNTQIYLIQKQALNQEQQYIRNQKKYKQSKSHSKKNQSLSQQLHSLQFQIKQEQKSLEKTNKIRNKSAQRKLFKIQIEQISTQDKKSIVQWLININLLNAMAASYYDKLHQICKNGVIFPEIINHQKGRGESLCYFKKPKRSAEVHSNYQKVFNYLKDQASFYSELLFLYEYFVPQAQQNAFWNLMLNCKNCFQKPYRKLSNSHLYTRQSAIKSKMSTSKIEKNTQNSRKHSFSDRKNQSSQRKLSQSKSNNNLQYNKIKYGSSQQFKQKSNSTSKRKTSLEFIRQIPYQRCKKQELIQKEQPLETFQSTNRGYRQLHEMKKNHSLVINTPQKKNNINDLSMSRSRINSNSIKKLSKPNNIPQIPSVSLQMQIKALKFLNQKKYSQVLQNNQNQRKTLFQDPIRNGTLLNLIIRKQFKSSHRYFFRPRNISDCRQNFSKAFIAIKNFHIDIPNSFQYHLQQIIRGQISIFYGIIWHLACEKTINPNSIQFSSQQRIDPQQRILLWIRTLQSLNQNIAKMQIRDIGGLISSLLNSNLLYYISEIILPQKYTISPTYHQTVNYIEQQSNLKKILGFLTHSKVIKSDYAWKARSIVKKDKHIIFQLLNDLNSYHTKQGNPENENIVSFNKYTKNKLRGQKERLQTTMINQTFSQQIRSNINISQKNINIKQLVNEQKQNINQQRNLNIQVPWMRKLGYTEDLSLNNGVVLCRLISQLLMQSIAFNERPQSKAECLTNLRKAIKMIEKFKWDQHQVAQADYQTNLKIYKFLKDKYKNAYAMKFV